MSYSSLGAQVWHVLMRDHSFTCHQHIYLQVEWTIPVVNPQLQSVNCTLAGTNFPSCWGMYHAGQWRQRLYAIQFTSLFCTENCLHI